MWQRVRLLAAIKFYFIKCNIDDTFVERVLWLVLAASQRDYFEFCVISANNVIDRYRSTHSHNNYPEFRYCTDSEMFFYTKKWQLTACLGLLAWIGHANALNNGVGVTPAMGWSSWNYFRCNINETLVKQASYPATDSMQNQKSEDMHKARH